MRWPYTTRGPVPPTTCMRCTSRSATLILCARQALLLPFPGYVEGATAMAASGGGYGGYGGGPHSYNYNNHDIMNGGYGSNGGGGAMADLDAREQELKQEEEEMRALYSLMEDLEKKCFQDERAAKDVQDTLVERAMERLEIEKDVRMMMEAHEEKVKVYRQKAADINEACSIRESMIKELQQKVQQSKEDVEKSLKKRHEITKQAKKEEREAIENQHLAEQERLRRQASASGDLSGTGGASAASTANGGYLRRGGFGMNRRTQSSTGESFFSRRESTDAAAAAARGGRASGRASGEVVPNGNGRQPRPFEQLRQACVEDTLTDFFGL
ncbi:unnamed protein product [Scytosiphon promiscuus]